MFRRIIGLTAIVPLLSSCPPDRYVPPVDYVLTDSDRLAIELGLGSFITRASDIDILTAHARYNPDMVPSRITVCGSFVLTDVDLPPEDKQPHLFGGILSGSEEGQKTFDVSSLEKPRMRKLDETISPEPTPQRLHRMVCHE